MDITKRLLELDPTLHRYNEGFWDGVFDPTSPGYSSFNDAGIEVETGEFLYGFVRMLKPDNVLETGTHIGVGASYMGMALKDNNKGHLYTIEYLPEIHEQAVARIQQMGLNGIVDTLLMDVKDFVPEKTYKFILLDTEPQTRFAELIKFFPSLEERGFVFIHDLHANMHQVDNAEHGFAWPYGPIPEEMKLLITSGKLRPFHFETPRGLTGFYKTSPEDYQW
jgi:hypothetical protein